MARKSKWIEAKSQDEPAPAVARRAIRARLQTVWKWLPLAAHHAEDDLEHVHQLRVATRRATAALHIFEPMLPRKRGRWYRKQLKRIRRAAAEARDLDVLAQRLAEQHEESPASAAALLERVAAARCAAQPAICEIHRQLKRRGFRRRIKKLHEKIYWRSSETKPPTFQASAHLALQPLAAAFFTAAEADFESTLALHQFRIAGKRLRYAMEVFADAFGPAFRAELYPLVEELQDRLGAVNDHAGARDRYLTWLDETHDESQRHVLGQAIALETAALQANTRNFRQWWTVDRAAELKAHFWQEVSPSEVRCA